MTDRHARNFCVFVHPGGGYAMTPLHDVLTAQPNLDARQIKRKQIDLAMSVGDNHHYLLDEIRPSHVSQTAKASGPSRSLVDSAVEDVAVGIDPALASLESDFPVDFPPALRESVSAGVQSRSRGLRAGFGSMYPWTRLRLARLMGGR